MILVPASTTFASQTAHIFYFPNPVLPLFNFKESHRSQYSQYKKHFRHACTYFQYSKDQSHICNFISSCCHFIREILLLKSLFAMSGFWKISLELIFVVKTFWRLNTDSKFPFSAQTTWSADFLSTKISSLKVAT